MLNLEEIARAMKFCDIEFCIKFKNLNTFLLKKMLSFSVFLKKEFYTKIFFCLSEAFVAVGFVHSMF